YSAITSGSGSSLNVDGSKIQISVVEEAPFQENISVNGAIIPSRSIYLDAVEGGRVERINVDAGENVSEGDVILVLTNNNLQLDVMNREAQILEQINTLRATRIQLQQQRLTLRNDLLTNQTELQRRKREFETNKSLYERGLVAEHQYLESEQLYSEALSRSKLYSEQVAIDSLAINAQFTHIDSSLENMIKNLDLVGEITDFLVVRAPISGQLTSLDAEIGETKVSGQRLGQIDITDSYKVRATVDEIYISRVEVGQIGVFDVDGLDYELSVTRIYPEVTDNRFQIDLDFTDQRPETIRRGQSVRLRLALSEVSNALILQRGAFFQQTGGRWIYVLSTDGDVAYKREIRIGRQNSQYYTIEDGLQVGDKVIISGYETFGDAEQLNIN
ncbi:MAG TPA: efflux transporter periplasmic adaptor subunit, partial [Bacteroidetes bacterium]|nr:efflux transporter periplasmic adaptor subunit [Bacteroidota bacterium]